MKRHDENRALRFRRGAPPRAPDSLRGRNWVSALVKCIGNLIGQDSLRGRNWVSALPLALGVLAMSLPVAAQDEHQYSASTGQQIYADKGCQVCHGGDGSGGVGAKFRGDPYLAFDQYIVARVMLGGGEMPSFAGKISDADLAAVASYIRNHWGNHDGDVSPQQVANARTHLESEMKANPKAHLHSWHHSPPPQ